MHVAVEVPLNTLSFTRTTWSTISIRMLQITFKRGYQRLSCRRKSMQRALIKAPQIVVL